MFRSITINNFRCFERFTIDSLSRVNLIAGRNSLGKTALLEALFLLIGAENLRLILSISQFRGLAEFEGDLQSVLELLWSPLFHKLDTSKSINIKGELAQGGHHEVELTLVPIDTQTLSLDKLPEEQAAEVRAADYTRQMLQQTFTGPSGHSSSFAMRFDEKGQMTINPFPRNPVFRGYFVTARRLPAPSEESNLYGKLIKSKRSYDLAKILEIVDRRLKDIAVIQSAGVPIIYGDIGLEQMLPISLLGEGIVRLMGILLRIANSPKGIVLIDEIENGFHYSILLDVWRAIGRAAELFDTQIFATTHSYDCIREAHAAFSESLNYDFRLHRLDRSDDTIEAVAYDREELAAAIKANFEVR